MDFKAAKLGMLLLAALALTACDKVTRENYDRLKMGMTYAEVVQLLGEPRQCDAVLVAKNCVWGKEPKIVTVNFVDDKVILYTSSGL